MNQIKTKNRYNNIGILFKLYVLNIHIQHCDMERFYCLIIEKSQAMKLSTNLLQKL